MFRNSLRGLVESAAKATMQEHPRVAIFGECVALLNAEGKLNMSLRSRASAQNTLLFPCDSVCIGNSILAGRRYLSLDNYADTLSLLVSPTASGTRTLISVPLCGLETIDRVPFKKLALSRMLINPMPLLCIAEVGSKPTP